MRATALATVAWMVAFSVLAAPPPGTDLNSPEHAWWGCQMQPDTGVTCCNVADGHVLKDEDWRLVPAGKGTDAHYEVRIVGVWIPVPPGKVINETQRCGPEPNVEHRAMAKVWYSPPINGAIESITIFCFEAGTLY